MSAYLKQVLLDAPIGYWPLDETSGTTAFDRSGNGRNGTYGGTYSLANFTTPLGVAPTFTSGYVDLGSPAAFDIRGLFTLEAWGRLTAYDASLSHIIAENFEGGTNAVYGDIYVNPSGIVSYGTYGPTWWAPTGTPTVSLLGTPTHFVYTYDGTTYTSYMNGQQIGTVVHAPPPQNYSGWTLGSRKSSGSYGEYHKGQLQHAAIYGTALSADRIKAHYEAGIRGGVMLG